MQTAKVGIQEFRENLSSYLEVRRRRWRSRGMAQPLQRICTDPREAEGQEELEAISHSWQKKDAGNHLGRRRDFEDQLVDDFKKSRAARRIKKA